MTQRTPLHSDLELKIMEMSRDARHYSYDLVQKLTFFVISIELVFCGYILLNAENLGAVKYSSLIFLLAGTGAVSGLLWRFFYNQTFHDGTHEKVTSITIQLYRAQNFAYWIFVATTTVFLLSSVIIGYQHIKRIEDAANPAPIVEPKVKASTMDKDKDVKAVQKGPNHAPQPTSALMRLLGWT